jgi:putative sigma-54 modulation protein
VTIHHETRAPFPAHTITSDKRHAGRTELSETQLELRSGGSDVDDALRAWVYERLGRQLGKYATQIERIQVRFGDENGPRGGMDKCCMVHVMLAKLPSVVVEMRGETEREAFDLAAGRAERATRRNIERHGFSAKHGKQKRDGAHNGADGMSMADLPPESDQRTEDEAQPEESLFGKYAGHGPDQLMQLQERPEKVRRDLPVDTSTPGSSATDRKVGYGHTGKRNTKLNTAGMSRALEDSTNGKPSRKSTRGGTNRIKPDNPLTRRTKAAVQSPKSQAGRVTTRGQ